MQKVTLQSQYAMPCPITRREVDGILYGASSVPGSSTLKYFPKEPELHKYSRVQTGSSIFHIPIIWKSEKNITPEYLQIYRKLLCLPLLDGSSVLYMAISKGYFFDLNLKGGVRITITQYEDEMDKGAYINVVLYGEVIVQDYMAIDDIVSSMKDYYHGSAD